MIFKETSLAGSFLISLTPFSDNRGWFARTYCKKEFSEYKLAHEWVQINHSFSMDVGTIRGMHFQHPPYSEVKLLRCISGAVFDVIIDLRKDSDSFLQWFGTTLSAKNRNMLYVPPGFAHGFQTLEPNTELIYHHSEFYKAEAEAGLLYNDTLLNIQWPLPISIISERDKSHPSLTSSFKGI